MATILELAELSSAVYGDTPVPMGWAPLPVTLKANSAGYYGVAYINTTTHEVVIANRGTVITNGPNDANDLYLLGVGFLPQWVLATGLSGPSPDQTDAINFAEKVNSYINSHYPGYSLIETGHSLGGSEAQAAVAALVDSGLNTTVSAVTFQGLGIGGAYYNPAKTYNVLNLNNQGDLAHFIGGTHLGTSATIAAGPTYAQDLGAFYNGFSAAVIPTPTAEVIQGAEAVGQEIHIAHKIATTVNYLASVSEGGLTAQQFENSSYMWGGTPGASISATGTLVLEDASASLTIQMQALNTETAILNVKRPRFGTRWRSIYGACTSLWRTLGTSG